MSELEQRVVVLDGTEAAVYAYGLVAARLPAGTARSTALSRDGRAPLAARPLRARITALGRHSPGGGAAYTPPFAVIDAASARRLAALVEDRLAGQWAGARRGVVERAARTRDALHRAGRAPPAASPGGAAPIWNGAA